MTLDASPGNSEGHISAQWWCSGRGTPDRFLDKASGVPLRPKLAKMDVQGHEEQVSLWRLLTIEEFRPVILCDCSDDATSFKVRAVLSLHGSGHRRLAHPRITNPR